MKSTQNTKILQQTESTLIVGIDVGKDTHYARAYNYRGIELAKTLRFTNTALGFKSLDTWMEETMQKYHLTDATVGFEPTGHYWFTLGDHLKRQGHRLAIVNPFHVKCTRELDDNSPTKNDRKDPHTIAMLVKDGRSRVTYIPEAVYQDLRESVSEHERLKEGQIAISNMIQRWLDIRFPEFELVFKAWTGKAAMLVLKTCPTPAHIVELGIEGILKIWQKEMQKPSRKKAERLLRVAQESIGRVDGTKAAVASLRNKIGQYELISQQCNEQECLMQELLLQVPNASKLLEIKGVGMMTAVVIVSEIGDVQRFDDPRQILKMAGLALKENSSGKHKGRTTISKRGRKLLRKGLFQCMISILASNAEFRAMHQRNLTREKNPLTKLQSVIALCGKLVKVMYVILTKGYHYNPVKMMNDMNRSMKAA